MTAFDADALDALTKLSDCQTAAFDRETVRCTLTVVCDESPLQSADCNVIRDEVEKAKVCCYCRCNVIRYDVEILHSMLKSSNALTILSVLLLAIELWSEQTVDLMSKKLHSISNDQMH